MPYIAPEVIIEARKMDLLTYLQNYEPQELVQLSRGVYCTRTHDSLKISNGKWCWHSRGIGGRTALDYLIKVRDLSFIDAVERIMGRVAIEPPVFISSPKEAQKPKEFVMPPASCYNTRMVDYLKKRGIDFDILRFCISTGRLYESYPYHNAVFVGLDEKGTPRYAALRSENFMGEATGSDKRYSFGIPAEAGSNTLHLFESPIDLLSYATLIKIHGQDWQRDHLLSLSGVYRPKAAGETATPTALKRFLEINPNIKKIVLRFDNDETGRLAVQTIRAVLPDSYEITDRPPPVGKDYNDYLCDRLGLSRTQRKNRSLAR